MNVTIVKKALAGCMLVCFVARMHPYGLRGLNLGLTNFLDGGPLRPRSGLYWINYNQYYHAHDFVDHEGNSLSPSDPPQFNFLANINQLLYESTSRILNARWGLSASIALVLFSKIDDNQLGFSSSGSGWGDFRADLYLQWDPVMYHGRAIYVNNLDFGVFFPTGKNDAPCHTINPGSKTYAINPYWAATVYLTQDWTVAWRLYYLWSTENPITHLQAGDAVHVNYSTEYKFTERFHAGINGYYLQQLHDNRLFGVDVPNSRERVMGLGPGFLYFFPHNLILLGHFYGEFDVRNRSKGINCVVRFIKYF